MHHAGSLVVSAVLALQPEVARRWPSNEPGAAGNGVPCNETCSGDFDCVEACVNGVCLCGV
jgi:hypothetical protein